MILILDLLGSLFDSGSSCVLGVYRSGITTFHEPIDGISVGTHPMYVH